MTIQQWLFSFKGRIGRRDFWIWIGLWFAGMLVLFSLAGKNLLDIQTAALCHPAQRDDAAGDFTGCLAMGGGAFCPDVDSGDDAYRSWCVCWHTRRK